MGVTMGLRDISAKLGNNYGRIRIGIGRPQYKGAEADYVLGRYRAEEQDKLDAQLKKAMTAIEKVIAEGYEAAQMNFNQKKKKKNQNHPRSMRKQRRRLPPRIVYETLCF